MWQVGLANLEQGPVETTYRVATDDPLLAGVEFSLTQPVNVTGEVSAAGEGNFYWHGSLKTAVDGTCRRCLAGITVPVESPIGVLFTDDQQADDASVYVIPPRSKALDLASALREELILAVPQFTLCRTGCQGLCPRCGKDLNSGPCDCGPDTPEPRWAGLADLKQRLENER
jgi:uncharacterized protein